MFKLHSLPRSLEAARRDAQSHSSKVRVSALADLSRFGEDPERSQAIEVLVAALGDPDVDVRARAALGLADLAAGEAVPNLMALLGDVQIRARQMAIVALGEIASPDDEEVVGRIGGLLHAGDAALRFQALAAWARLSPARLEQVVIEAMRDQDIEVRALAVRLVEEHFVESEQRGLTEPLRAALRTALDDEVSGVRLLSALALGRAGERPPTSILVDAVARRRGLTEASDEQLSIELCGQYRVEEAIPALRRRAFGLFGISRDPFAWQACVALARMNDERARSMIRRGLDARQWDRRAAAAWAAGRAGMVELLPTLEGLARGESKERETVLEAISMLRPASSSASGVDAPPSLS